MPLVSTQETMDEILCGTFVDYINTWATVHDEADLIVPTFLRDAIMNKVVSLASLKDLLDKYGLPGLAMSFDVEFDKWGSWTASSSVDIYSYPSNAIECAAHEAWAEYATCNLKPSITVAQEGRVVTRPLADVTQSWLDEMKLLPDGVDTILIQTDGSEFFEYERKVTLPPEVV